MTKTVPAVLAARGIHSVSDNLPAGATLDVAEDFVRLFRPEIEAQVLGLDNRPAPRLPADFLPVRR